MECALPLTASERCVEGSSPISIVLHATLGAAISTLAIAIATLALPVETLTITITMITMAI